jgi:hypothetical protein
MSPVPIDVANLTNNGGSINFWSDSLGGQGQIPLSSCTFTFDTITNTGITSCATPTSGSKVIFFADAIVYPGDNTVATSFACYDNCPTVVSGQATISNMTSGPSNTATNYSFDRSALMLKDQSGAPVILTVTDPTQQYGIQSGPLFDPAILSQINPDTGKPYLQCDWMNPQGSYDVCSWKAWSDLPAFYTWETGPNNWNQFIGVKDSNGVFVKFDTPLMVKYVGIGDPYGTLGTSYILQYGGYGQLNGIPGKCVNMDTGADADCSQSGNGNNSIRWVPQFTIPTLTGGQPTTVTDGSNTYYVKPLQVEQRMKADPGACTFASSIDFSSYALPDLTIWSDPVTANGTEPSVTDAPAVIGGVVQ